MKSFVIPMQVIPEHTVTRCEDCPDFENRGGSWGEYDACRNWDRAFTDIDDRCGDDIPDSCPRLKQKEDEK